MIGRPPDWRLVWRLQIHAALPSTSDVCRERAAAGEPEGLAVLAHRQTAGRGTHGRTWDSPPGNLYVSVLLRPGGSIAQAPQWGLLAAVALAESLEPHLDRPHRLRLKWPNDLMLDGSKIAGLLAEASADKQGNLDWLVIGIGANLATSPSVPDRPTACVGPSAPSPETFAGELLQRLTAWRMRVATEGFAPMRAAWLTRGPALGHSVDLRLGGTTRSGLFTGLADDGSLLLSSGGTVRAFAAGET